MYSIEKLPKCRKHTLNFLHTAIDHASVYLHAEIDVTRIINAQKNNSSGYIAHLIFIITKIIKNHARANSYFRKGFFPKIITYKSVSAKFTLDKFFANERIVASGVIHDANRLTVNQLQAKINLHRQADVSHSTLYSGIRTLHKLPLWLGKIIMSLALKNPTLARNIQGTFSISSLGKSSVSAFLPLTTTTLGFGVGQITDKPIANANQIEVRPILPLTLVFDHRVLDGAAAAEILGAIKYEIEYVYGENAYV